MKKHKHECSPEKEFANTFGNDRRVSCENFKNYLHMKKITLKTAILATIALFGWSVSSSSQVTLIYPDATPNASFTTIKAAYDSIFFPNHPGAHTIRIEGTYSAAAETYPVVLGSKTDASASNKVTIKPATGAKIVLGPSNQTVIATGVTFASGATTVELDGKITNGDISQISTSSYIAGIGVYASTEFKKVSAISGTTVTLPTGTITAASAAAGNRLFFGPGQTCAVKFSGAKYVTIDGISRTDANTGLTIQNPNSIYAQTIFFAGNSQYNTVQNCILRGANHSGAWNNGFQGTVYFQAGTGNTCSYNTIDNNDICDMNDPNIPFPIAAIQMTAAGGTHTYQTISNNNIYNISNQYAGNGTCTFMQFGSEGLAVGHSVLNNKFYWTAPTTFSTAAVNFINCGTLGLGHKFEGNTIGYASAEGTGTAYLTFLGSGGTIYGTSNPKNFTCKNNTVANLNITGTTGAKAFVGLQIPAATTGATASPDNCFGNTVKDIVLNSNGGNGTLYGIMLPAAPIYNLDIKNNVVKNLTCQSTGATYTNIIYGLSANFASSGTIAINCISNEFSGFTAGNAGSSAANVITAFMSGGCNVGFEKNLICNLNTISTGTGSLIKGIRLAISTTDGKLIKNNIIRLGTDVTSDAEISAIIDEGLSSNGHPLNIYHNTIYIGGTSQTKPSHCFNHSTGTNYGLISLKNNIFSNVRSGGSAYNQVYNLLATNEIYSSEYNLYQYGTRFATIPDVQTTLGDWNILNLDFETGSKDNQDPKFTDANATIPDMHLTSGSPADAAGLNLSATVADDFYGNDRSALSPHDLGAIAYYVATATGSVSADNLVFAVDGNIVFKNLSGKNAAVYSFSGQLLKSVQLSSDFVSIPVAKGLYLVNVNGEVTKVMLK